jgi:pimeloyl-ACP methyl ester carboxylesterase
MPLRAETFPGPEVLLVMVPGMGMQEADFHAKGLTTAVAQRGWPVTIAIVDPGVDSYLDNSVETRLLAGIAEATHTSGARRVWLAGISLGCQAILRAIRLRPDLAEGAMLLTPYLASTGLIAEADRAGGLRRWAATNRRRDQPERDFLAWLATASPAELPFLLIGRARIDRFASTATMLADLVPAGRLLTVSGEHDWASWTALWDLMLDQQPFTQRAVSVP